MPTLTTIQKAPILDQDGVQLSTDNSVCFSDDNSIVSIGFPGPLFAIAQGEGTTTITATRLIDNSQSSLEITVTSEGVTPFSISLGAPVSK